MLFHCTTICSAELPNPNHLRLGFKAKSITRPGTAEKGFALQFALLKVWPTSLTEGGEKQKNKERKGKEERKEEGWKESEEKLKYATKCSLVDLREYNHILWN